MSNICAPGNTCILKFANPSGERIAVNQYAASGTRKGNGTGRKVVVRNDHRFVATVVLHACDSIADGTAGNLGPVALHLDGDFAAASRCNKVNTKVATSLSHAHAVALGGEQLLEVPLEVNASHRINVRYLYGSELPVLLRSYDRISLMAG
jgi:hypothetical protein